MDIKLGSFQNDIVSVDEKLSSIFLGVRVVGRVILTFFCSSDSSLDFFVSMFPLSNAHSPLCS